ncbi:MAG: PepSY domain-containing protein [Clostridium celatum]|uniref:PepSY domain-containing protein n=1 Tax=uncultured Clostridium sp. TaxID=59620 RepID=UPI0025D09BEF|nr:PepSY domain-containing protein [uncultured Clostridium sp.]MDU4883680.1 PepSY domain-containing protein [Clostridium celatum]MDU5261832.1 PepSY domain-containing protein [Clostridium celatum]MDU7076573.1 PepSY domain-containing protein [Clostridium celatum]
MKRLKLATIITIISISLMGCSNSEELNNKTVTIDEAKEIALKHAGLTSDQVSFVEVESDVDNNIEKYNIEFYHGDKEYDYEINSANGEIIKYDYDMEYNNNVNNTNNEVNISEEQVKEIALKHAGLTNDQVSFIKLEKDIDNGTQKYDIEFYYNNVEYSYEIDANTGDILSYERD